IGLYRTEFLYMDAEERKKEEEKGEEEKKGREKRKKKKGGGRKRERGKKEEKEVSGSSAYVPKEPKDTQLQYALSFLRGTATGPTVAKPADPPANSDAPAADNKSTVPN
ncbi:hypothetical protein B4Q13_20055, partial [Lacticaseibacillus rhamnosus]